MKMGYDSAAEFPRLPNYWIKLMEFASRKKQSAGEGMYRLLNPLQLPNSSV